MKFDQISLFYNFHYLCVCDKIEKKKNKNLRGEMRGKEEEGDQDDQGLKIYNG